MSCKQTIIPYVENSTDPLEFSYPYVTAANFSAINLVVKRQDGTAFEIAAETIQFGNGSPKVPFRFRFNWEPGQLNAGTHRAEIYLYDTSAPPVLKIIPPDTPLILQVRSSLT